MTTPRLLIALCLLVISFSVIAQQQTTTAKAPADTAKKAKPQMRTIFGNDNHKIEHGGYGAFTMSYTQINGDASMLMGGRGGWLIDHHLTLGLGGYGYFSDMHENYNTPPTEDNYSLAGGYGGFFFEPIINPNSPVHIAIPVMIGGGGVSVVDSYYYHNNPNYYNYNVYSYFVFEPGVDVEFNIVKFMRIALNASYRYTSDIHLDYVSPDGMTKFSVPSDAIRGMNFGMTFKFGKF